MIAAAQWELSAEEVHIQALEATERKISTILTNDPIENEPEELRGFAAREIAHIRSVILEEEKQRIVEEYWNRVWKDSKKREAA